MKTGNISFCYNLHHSLRDQVTFNWPPVIRAGEREGGS